MPALSRSSLLRRFLPVLAVFLHSVFLFIALGEHSRQKYGMQYFVYSSSNEGGISLSRYDESTGEISAPVAQPGPPRSFFIATHLTHPGGPRLYSLDAAERQALAYSIGADGSLTLINSVATEGAVPCHLAVDAERSLLFVANYNGDTVVLPILEDGSLGPVAASHHQPGSSIHERRQTGTHPHGVAIAGETLYVADLGTDDIACLAYHPACDGAPARLAPISAGAGALKLKAGAGPRHIAFHRDARRAVAVNELDNTVTAVVRDAGTGALSITDSLSTLPEGGFEETWTAEIGFHPTVDVCYATNRGHDSIALFALDSEGKLARKAIVPSGGKFPQHLSFTASGRTLFVAHTNSGTIVRFAVDPATGDLSGDAVEAFPLAKPMCILAIPADSVQP